MITKARNNDGCYFLATLILLLVIRLIFLFFNPQPLSVDEAQYWIWSKQLAWGYHSKPPLIAFIIHFSTLLFGDSEFGVRIFATLSYAVTASFIYLSTRQFCNSLIARWSGLTFLIMPAVSVSSSIMSTDPFMLMFCAISLYAFILALEQPEKIIPWIFSGIFIGLSALTKYTGVVFLLSFYLFIFLHPSKRKLITHVKTYIPILITLIVLSPNIHWNVQHHFSTMNHVFHHNISVTHLMLNPLFIFSFLGSQLFVFSPILFPLLCYTYFTQHDWKDRFFTYLSSPMLIAVSLKSIFGKVVANWAALTYLAGTPLVVKFLLVKNKKKLLLINFILCALLSCAYYIITFTYFNKIVHFKKAPAFFRKVSGWRELTDQLSQVKSAYPKANYLFDNRRVWSELTYYGKLPLDRIYTINDSSIDFAKMVKKSNKAQYIIFSADPVVSRTTAHSFKQIKSLKTLQAPINGAQRRIIYVFLARG